MEEVLTDAPKALKPPASSIVSEPDVDGDEVDYELRYGGVNDLHLCRILRWSMRCLVGK